MTARFASLIIVCLAMANQAWSTNWPQFLGPARNGVYSGSDLADAWPGEGPPILWQKSIGQGFSAPVVTDHKLILFHRLADKETIEALDANTGKQLWYLAYPTHYSDDFGFDEGPRATPCIADGFVCTFGAEGMLNCLNLSDGKKQWSVDTRKEFGARKGFFGIVCSPLVEGNAVLLNVGGTDNASIVAFDKSTGKTLWKSYNDEASYSAPTVATINGNRYALFLTRSALVALNPVDGKVYFTYPFRPPLGASVTAATPQVIGDLIFISGSYGNGAVLLRIKDGKPEKVWAAQDVLSNHYATSIYHDGFLYGIDGRTDPGFQPGPSLRCVELKTGKVRWKQDDFGAATLTLAGDQLLIVTERGELIRAKASPDSFQPIARAEVLPNHIRSYPAIADGLFYARSKDKLFCLDLRKPAK
ncbi:PQQ-binding-like beta-propeller repeat protein [Pedosphaera parvula]|nr:PQQ-binding-like beta-propeller repeat protein [Pedosphaera parvula]